MPPPGRRRRKEILLLLLLLLLLMLLLVLVLTLAVLEQELSKHQWLGGAERFTAADLNVSVVLGWCYYLSKLFEPCPRVTDWMKRCHSRPLSPYNRVPPAYSQKAGVPGKEGAFPWDTAGFDERYSKL